MNRRIILAGMLSGLATSMASSHASVSLKRFRIDFPAHRLEFSLPDEFLRGSLPTPIENYFDPEEPGAFEKNGFRTLAEAMHDFNGRFWDGALGSLKVTVLAQERSKKFSGEISDIDGLENYIAWWIPRVRNPILCTFARVSLNGTASISRRFDSLKEILSFPVDDCMFVEIALDIERWTRKSGGAWITKAQQMFADVRGSITFRPR